MSDPMSSTWTLCWTVVNPHLEGYDEDSRYTPSYDYNSGMSFWIRVYIYSATQQSFYSQLISLYKPQIYGLWSCILKSLQDKSFVYADEEDQVLMIRPSTLEFGLWKVGDFVRHVPLEKIHAISCEQYTEYMKIIRDSIHPLPLSSLQEWIRLFLQEHVPHFDETVRVMEHVQLFQHQEEKRKDMYQHWMLTVMSRCLTSAFDLYGNIDR